MTTIAANPDDLVARFTRPGIHVHLAMTPSRPNAATAALARRYAGTRSLTVSMTAVHSTAHALALASAVRKMITGFLGDTYPTPRPNVLYRDLQLGKPFDVEVWSLLSMLQRLMAGATGVPYTVTNSLRGSDLRHGKGHELIEFQGQDLLLATAMRPDITIVHGVCADSRGNVIMLPPYGEGAWSAYAATEGVLATVEQIVPDRVIDENPGLVVIPGQRVLAVCEARRGAHPQSLRTDNFAGISGYQDDYQFLAELARRGRSIQAMQDWYVSYVNEQAVREPTDEERTILLGARAIEGYITDGGYDTVLAGIGASHMAAWLAADRLRRRGVTVQVCAEVGMYGQHPLPGDVYLFSQQHQAQQFTGIAEILGGMVVGNASRCLGVLSAGEIDPVGNINTCWLPDGRWLTGSGGANDIASGVDCVVIASATPKRYVDSVAHVTSPGRNVRAVISQFGRFERSDAGEKLQLRTWLPGSADSPATAVSQCTRWPTPDRDRECDDEAGIRADELATLRLLDPEGHYR